MRRILLALLALGPLVLCGRPAAAQTTWPGQTELDTILHDVTFDSGERLAEMRLHAITLGTPHRDTAGHIDNAVLILHGSGSCPSSPTRYSRRASRWTWRNTT